MPIYDRNNTVTVGHICLSCALYLQKICPYGNHLRAEENGSPRVLEFEGEPGTNKCHVYNPVVEANKNNKMIKSAKLMKESELNVALFKKISTLNQEDRKKLFNYWNYLFPDEFAEDMVTDYNESEQKNIEKKT